MHHKLQRALIVFAGLAAIVTVLGGCFAPAFPGVSQPIATSGAAEPTTEPPTAATTPETPAAQPGGGGIEGQDWQLVSLGAAQAVAGSEATMLLNAGLVKGTTGCNSYGGPYELGANNALKFGTLAMTQMACVGPVMVQEQAFTRALGETASYGISGVSLTLLDASGATLATFEPRKSAALAGTPWIATGINNGKGGVVSTATTELTTALFAEDGTLSGNGGCNSYSASYEADGAKITISPPISTKMACDPALLDQETAYFAALANAATYRIDGNKLEIRDEGGALLVSYVAGQAAVAPTEPAPGAELAPGLVGDWQLVTVGGQPAVEGADAFLTLNSDRTDSGSTGCNSFSGSFEGGNGGVLSFGPQAMTMMACAGPLGAQEQAFSQALADTTGFNIFEGMLALENAAGDQIASFTPRRSLGLGSVVWIATAINNGKGAVVSAVEGVEVTAMFGPGDTLSGSGGCNTYSAAYDVDGDKLMISPPITTLMACADPAVNDQEAAYLAALPNSATYTISGDKLEIRDETGALLVGYTAGAAPALPVETPSVSQPVATPPADAPGISQPIATPPGAGIAEGQTLPGTEWQLVQVGGTPAVATAEAYLSFGMEGELSGSTGCNRMAGRYKVDGTKLDFQVAMMTRKYCEGLMEQERAFIKAIAETYAYSILADGMALIDRSGQTLASFQPRAVAPLVRTGWVATMINNGKGAVGSVIPGVMVNAMFEADGTVHGESGCNSYSSGYTTDAGKIAIDPPIATMKACADQAVMDQEAAFLAALPKAATYRIDGDELELRDADGALLVSFKGANG